VPPCTGKSDGKAAIDRVPCHKRLLEGEGSAAQIRPNAER